jgi:hypothetical protein
MPFMGDCPYDGCSGSVWIVEPEPFDRVFYHRTECEECGGATWTRLSRVESWSITEAEFLERFKVDEEAKTIEERNPPQPLTEVEKMVLDALREEWEHRLLWGDG